MPYQRFWVSGRTVDDWTWVPYGLALPKFELGQGDPYPPVGFPLWTVSGYDTLRLGAPAGTIWLSIDSAEDEWKLIEAIVSWEREDRLHPWPVDRDQSLFGDVPLDPDDRWADDLPFYDLPF